MEAAVDEGNAVVVVDVVVTVGVVAGVDDDGVDDDVEVVGAEDVVTPETFRRKSNT